MGFWARLQNEIFKTSFTYTYTQTHTQNNHMVQLWGLFYTLSCLQQPQKAKGYGQAYEPNICTHWCFHSSFSQCIKICIWETLRARWNLCLRVLKCYFFFPHEFIHLLFEPMQAYKHPSDPAAKRWLYHLKVLWTPPSVIFFFWTNTQEFHLVSLSLVLAENHPASTLLSPEHFTPFKSLNEIPSPSFTYVSLSIWRPMPIKLQWGQLRSHLVVSATE